MRKTSIVLIAAAYVLLFYISVSAPPHARAHPQLGAAVIGEYAGPWPVALGCVVALSGFMLVFFPIRRGERWAILTSLVTFAALFVTRMATDPRCLVVLDPHQHGCHSFMIAIVLGMVGLGLAWKQRQ